MSPTQARNRIGSAAALLALASAVAACEGQAAAVLAALGDGCSLNSDCTDGLACVFEVCHVPCETTEDCPLDEHGDHQSCIVGDKPVRVCRLDSEAGCTRSSDCPGALVCAMDDECRNQCDTDRDCPASQVCAGATCAGSDELGPGGLLALKSGTDPRGKPCAYTSDCPEEGDAATLVCREGVCATACFGDDRDCGRFERCSTTAAAKGEPGACELIGEPGALFCSPHPDQPDSEVPCACLGGGAGSQTCKEDGSGYGPCLMGDVQCDAM